MKKNFIKTNIASIFVVCLFIVSSLYYVDIAMIVATIIFIVLLVNNYKNYDADEQDNNEWWNSLSRKDKKELYLKSLPKSEKEENEK